MTVASAKICDFPLFRLLCPAFLFPDVDTYVKGSYIFSDVGRVSLTGMLQRGSESSRPEETESYTPHHQENGKYQTNIDFDP